MRRPGTEGPFAVRFFFIAAGLLIVAGAAAVGFTRAIAAVGPAAGALFPPAFAASTACLLFGSWAMSRAVEHVRRERQAAFRRCLTQAVWAGTLFLAVQSSALAAFFRQQIPEKAPTGATSFIAVAVALHGLHFLVAWLFVLYVSLQARDDRYDHEYHAGVVFCAWFWHALGIVWFAVLCVMAIANQNWGDDGVQRELSNTAIDVRRGIAEATDCLTP